MSKFVVRHPGVITTVVLVLTALSIIALRRGLILDVSPESFVERESQAKADFEVARKHFGSDQYLVVAVVSDDFFDPANLTRLRRLHEQIERTNGVAELLSLINVPHARSIKGGASLENLLPASFDNPTRLNEARRIATGDRLYSGNLISPDARTAALNILLKPDLPTETRHQVTRKIYETTRNAGFAAGYFAGDPFSQWRGTEAIKSDLRVFLPVTLILIAVLLWLCFRSFAAVVLPLGTIGIGLIWLLGLMAFLNAHFTILALMLPTLMLAIGCSYMIHVLNQIGIMECGVRNAEYRNEMDPMEMTDRPSEKQQDSSSFRTPHSALRTPHSTVCILEAMRFINLPVVVSAMTIIAGFLSLAFTKIPAIRVTAIFAAIGAALTMILSLTFIPAVLTLLGPRAMTFRIGLGGKMVRLLEETGRWATSHQTALYLATALIVIVSFLGMSHIKIDIDYYHFFKPSSETSIGLAEINNRLSGAINFDIIIEGSHADAIEDPQILQRIAEIQSFAEAQIDVNGQGISRTISVVDFIKQFNRAFHDDHPKFYSIPEDRQVIGELLSDRDQLRGFLSADGSMARILVRSTLSGSQAMASVIRTIEARGRELLPDCRVFATGTTVLLNRTSDQIAGEQVQSISIALVTIFLMLSMLFRSFRVGLTALVPNLIPVLFFFGFMGWKGIELNLTTSLVASVVLGLAVDNSVQFIVRFRRVQTETSTLRDAIIQSMCLSGRPIIYANIALAAAFALFSLSNFAPIASFGLLSAVTIIGCLIEDLVLLPARLTSPVFRAMEKRRAPRDITAHSDT